MSDPQPTLTVGAILVGGRLFVGPDNPAQIVSVHGVGQTSILSGSTELGPGTRGAKVPPPMGIFILCGEPP